MPSFSIALQGNKPLAEYRALAELAEMEGFDGISVYADLGFQPAIVPLLEMARVTRRVRLGPAALNASLIHPVEIAGQIAMLDHASQGRAYLGLVRGAWLDALGIEVVDAVGQMREAIEVIYQLLAGSDKGFEGRYFHLPPARLFQYPVLRPDPPLLIGSWGPRMLALAGEVAGEAKVGGSANPKFVPEVRRRLTAGEAASKRLEQTKIVFGAVTVVDEDGAAARNLARIEVARYLPVVALLDPTVSIEPEMLDRMAVYVEQGESAQAAMLVSDELLDCFAFSGTPEQVAAQASALFEAGVARVEFGTPQGLESRHGIQLLGQVMRMVPPA